jgi:glutaredoxin-related protein
MRKHFETLYMKPCGNAMPRCGISDVLSAIAQATPATAKATQKELTLVQLCDFGHVPLAQIRIELAVIRKRCTGSHAAMPCHDGLSEKPRCGFSNPATAKATKKELTFLERSNF